MRTQLALLAVCVALLSGSIAEAGDFAVRDGDTLVFLGDSITAARTYGKLIENYTLLRYPERKVRFINAGWGGDTAAGGLARLERDVFSRGATLLTVAYGINDIGWGGKADHEHRQRYLDSIRGIVEACKAKGVRVFICSAALTAGDRGDDDYLQKMCDEGMAISKSLGQGAIDVQRTMRGINARVKAARQKDPKLTESLHVADGIHLSDLGQLAMGFAILKGLGAPADVSSVTIDWNDPAKAQASGCRLSDIEKGERGLVFTRLDEGLPLNLEPLWQLNFRFIPFPDELNRYMLTVRNLPPGEYQVRAGDRPVGTFDAKRLSEGVNLGSATPDAWLPGGPWDAQAHLVKRLTEARNEDRMAALFAPDFLKSHPQLKEISANLDAVDTAIVQAQRNLARPVPYRFEITPRSAKHSPN